MLKLKAIKSLPLNCSSGGVLYHYTHTIESLQNILEEGLKPSYRSERTKEGKITPFISFSRTRVNPAYAQQGDNPWAYGIMFSRNKISNLGKLTPYMHGGYDGGTFNELIMTVKDPEFIAKPEDNLYQVTIAVQHIEYQKSVIKVAIGSKNLDNLWNDSERLNPDEANNIADWLIKNASKIGLKVQKVVETTEENKKYDDGTKYVVVTCVGKVNLDELSAALPELPRKVLQEARNEIDKSDMGTEPATSVEIKLENEDEGTIYRFTERFTKADIMDIYNRISAIEYSQDRRGQGLANAYVGKDGYWELIVGGTDEEIEQIFHDKPGIVKAIEGVSQYRAQESEDRLWLPNADWEKPVPGTKEAIIGVLFPREKYYSDEANAIREKYPNLPIYAYAEYGSSGLSEGSKPIPKEAYRNPVA